MYWHELGSMDPFASVRALQRQMNRLFDGYGAEEREAFPAVNLWSNAEEVIVQAEVPGVDPKDVEISVQGDQLTLQGERKADESPENVVCSRAERGSGRFTRSFRLPFEVDNTKASARCANGVLTVTLPRTETSKPRKIAIAAD
ncbi:MAG: Hsp20/alpha crystallin family protein [Verrucomicrobia bacterium]|nr:Hsp20/alpha crystallin family protein [Verrucomicrobiota bacterium]